MLWTAAVFPPPARAQDAGAADPAPADRPPRLRRFVPAAYPAAARAEGRAAVVVLDLAIDETGRVTDVTVAEPAGDGFDEAAVAAARQFEFDPPLREGRPTAARIRYTCRFAPAAPTATPAPAAVLEGVVRGAQDRPVAGARVELERADDGATEAQPTGADGAFRFELARPGRVAVTVTAPGFAPLHLTEDLVAREALRVTYRLAALAPPGPATPSRARPASRGGGDEERGVVVRGARPRREVSRTTLERAEIVRAPGTLGDALRALQNLPGLARAPFLSGSLIVRGSSPNDTQVLLDGTPLPALYHFGALGSVIPTDMLDRIDLYPANFSARFGRATGGVVDVGLRSPRRRGARSAVQIGLLDANAYAEAAVAPNLSIAVGARFAYWGFLASPIVTALTRASAFVGYWDYQGVAEWRPTGRDRVRFALFGSSDTVAFYQPSESQPDSGFGGTTNQGFHLAQLSWTRDLAPQTQSRAVVAFGRVGLAVGSVQVERGVTTTAGPQLTSLPLHARWELSHALSPAVRVNLGVDALLGPRSYRETAERDGTRVTLRQDDAAVVQPGVYLESEITPVPGLRLVPGLRVDYAASVGAAVVSPRASARWTFRRGWTLRAGLGHYVQPPLRDRLTMPPELLLLQGRVPATLASRFERALHAALGVEHEISRWVSLAVEGYYKSITDALVGFPSIDLILANEPGALDPNPAITSDGIGRAYGLEVLLRHRMSDRFFGWIAYTLSRAERRDSPASGWRPFEWDQTHNFVALGSYDLGNGWQLGGRFRYVTGRPTTRGRVVYDAEQGRYVNVPGVPFGVRVFDFHQLDIRLEKRWVHRWGTLTFFAEVLNVYNRQNAERFEYSSDGTENAPGGAFLPILPNVGLRGEL